MKQWAQVVSATATFAVLMWVGYSGSGSGSTKSGSRWPLVFEEDFSGGLGNWLLHPKQNWQLSVVDGDTVLCLTKPGVQGPVRAPTAWAVIRDLDLRRPIYRQTACYGHFGRDDLDLPWEKTDKVEILRKEALGKQ